VKAWVQYGKVVQGKWGPETVTANAIPEETVDEEGNTTLVYDYSDRLESAILDNISKDIGNDITVIVIDNKLVSEGLIWKALGDILSKY